MRRRTCSSGNRYPLVAKPAPELAAQLAPEFALKLAVLMPAMVAAALLPGCGLISSQSVYEGVRSTDKAKAVITDKSRSELPPYDQYQKERTQGGK